MFRQEATWVRNLGVATEALKQNLAEQRVLKDEIQGVENSKSQIAPAENEYNRKLQRTREDLRETQHYLLTDTIPTVPMTNLTRSHLSTLERQEQDIEEAEQSLMEDNDDESSDISIREITAAKKRGAPAQQKKAQLENKKLQRVDTKLKEQQQAKRDYQNKILKIDKVIIDRIIHIFEVILRSNTIAAPQQSDFSTLVRLMNVSEFAVHFEEREVIVFSKSLHQHATLQELVTLFKNGQVSRAVLQELMKIFEQSSNEYQTKSDALYKAISQLETKLHKQKRLTSKHERLYRSLSDPLGATNLGKELSSKQRPSKRRKGRRGQATKIDTRGSPRRRKIAGKKTKAATKPIGGVVDAAERAIRQVPDFFQIRD